MYVTEAMIQSMEDMIRNASDMEKSIKAMMETEGRMHGVELDRRHNARDMWAKLSEHMAHDGTQSSMMTEADWHQPMDTHVEPVSTESGLVEGENGQMVWQETTAPDQEQ